MNTQDGEAPPRCLCRSLPPTEKKKKTQNPTSSWKTRTEILSQHEPAAAHPNHQMKGQVPSSPSTSTAAHVCSHRFQALLLIPGKSQLCVGVAGMIQQRNLHGWKRSMPMENRNFGYPLQARWQKSPFWSSPVGSALSSCSSQQCRGQSCKLDSIKSATQHENADVCVVFYSTGFSTPKNQGWHCTLVIDP